jgi:hypothetical protein
MAIADVRKELAELKGKLPAVDGKIDDAKTTSAALLPDAGQLAYLKVAKADASEIRDLITTHIEEDHRRNTLERALEANRLAKIAIGVSVPAAIAAAFGIIR